jgi:hypothetical protein
MLCAAALVLLAGATQAARADVIFNNFGSGDSYLTDIGWTIGRPPGQVFFEQADSFTVHGTDFNLSGITAAAGNVLGPNVYSVGVYTDAGNMPGSLLEMFNFSNLGQFGLNNPPLVGNSSLQPLLQDGHTYWLVYSTSDTTWAAANLNSTNDIGGHVFRTNGGAWGFSSDIHGAFRVEGDPVPEPGTLVLLGMGALGLVGYGYRRRTT